MIVLRGAREVVAALQFSPDGRTLVGVFSGGAQLWNDLTASGPPADTVDYQSMSSARFTPDGRKLVLGGHRIVVHDLLTREEAAEVPLDVSSSPEVYWDLTPDGRYIVAAQVTNQYIVAGQVATRKKAPSPLSCWPVANPTAPVWSAQATRPIYSPPLFLAGGGRFVVFEGQPETTIPFWYVTRDTRTGEVVSQVPGTGHGFHHPVMSLDRRLIAGRWTTWVGIFRAEDMRAEPMTFRNDSRKQFTGLAFHPSGRYLAATSNDRTVKLYDTATWSVAQAYTWGVGRLRSVAFSPDGMLAAAGGDTGKIVVWDVDL